MTLPLAGRVGEVGLKEHVAPLGRLEHWKLTVPVAPFCEFTVMVKLAACPAETVVELGAMLVDIAGAGATPVTSRVAATSAVNVPSVAITSKL